MPLSSVTFSNQGFPFGVPLSSGGVGGVTVVLQAYRTSSAAPTASSGSAPHQSLGPRRLVLMGGFLTSDDRNKETTKAARRRRLESRRSENPAIGLVESPTQLDRV